MITDLLKNVDVIFWDFDGVIKDSVNIKSDAFEQLFIPFGNEVAKKVKKHHESSGMPRYDKFPIYLQWAGQEISDNLIEDYCQRFSKLVKQKVIDSAWTPGVYDCLANYHDKIIFFLITNTPQSEIEEILSALNINLFFKEIFGSPKKKTDAIKILLSKYSVKPYNSLMIGDTVSDCDAANNNNVPFILRRTKENKILQKQLKCTMIDNFS